MIRRHLERELDESLSDTPVVLVAGARQTGKSTFVENLARAASFVTLDDAATRLAAQQDPQGFVAGLPAPAVIDEVQRVPELFLALKAVVDADRRPGRFVLTGSADIMLLPGIADALAGRMEIHTLWPFSQGELRGAFEGFVDAAFSTESPVLPPSGLARADYLAQALKGGYPEVVARESAQRRAAWFRGYSTTILQRDIKDLAEIEGIDALPQLLRLIAHRSGSTLNLSDISREIGIPQTTLKRYLTLLRATFLVQPLAPWHRNVAERVVRSPKLQLNDPGLHGFLAGLTLDALTWSPSAAGPLIETFVGAELRKQAGWSQTRPDVSFFRTHRGAEVDFVLESRDGRVVAIEVKATTSLSSTDGHGLRAFRELVGDRYHRGILLYTGAQTLPFGDRTWAMPIDALWRWGAREPD